MSKHQNKSAVALHDGLAQEWEDKYTRPRFKRRSDHFLSFVEALPLAGQFWLDAGCGTGFLSRKLLERGCRIMGVDASQEMLNVARALADEQFQSRSLLCKVSSVDNLPLPDNVCDGVICSSVLEYLDEPQACLKEIARVLKPSGVLIISVPNRQSLLRKALKLTHWISNRLFSKPCPYYIGFSVNEYTWADFLPCLESNGLKYNSYDYYCPIGLDGLFRTWTGSLLVCSAIKQPLNHLPTDKLKLSSEC